MAAVDASHIPYMRPAAGLDADSFARLAGRLRHKRPPLRDTAQDQRAGADRRRA